MPTYVPVIVAVISAVTVLTGYLIQKRKERDFELNKTRQDLYMRFVRNLTEKLDLFDKLRKTGDLPDRVTHDDIDAVMSMIEDKLPELLQNIKESVEIGALMALYASDDAIKSCADFYRTGWESLRPDSGSRADKNVLLHQLRKSLFRRTRVSVEDIRFISTK